jgi:hypothetical protein
MFRGQNDGLVELPERQIRTSFAEGKAGGEFREARRRGVRRRTAASRGRAAAGRPASINAATRALNASISALANILSMRGSF